jgi:hypothetical protein
MFNVGEILNKKLKTGICWVQMFCGEKHGKDRVKKDNKKPCIHEMHGFL